MSGPYDKPMVTSPGLMMEDSQAFRIPGELDHLEQNIQNLSMVVDTLVSRLSPVMRDNMNKTQPSDPAVVDGNPSNVALRIMGVNWNIDRLGEEITNILRRLEV